MRSLSLLLCNVFAKVWTRKADTYSYTCYKDSTKARLILSSIGKGLSTMGDGMAAQNNNGVFVKVNVDSNQQGLIPRLSSYKEEKFFENLYFEMGVRKLDSIMNINLMKEQLFTQIDIEEDKRLIKDLKKCEILYFIDYKDNLLTVITKLNKSSNTVHVELYR